MDDFTEFEKLEPVEQKRLFSMTVVVGAEISPCNVYEAKLADGTRFTRVIMNESHLGRERIVDVDYWEGIGWIDMYLGEPSAWSDLVATSLDFYDAGNKNA